VSGRGEKLGTQGGARGDEESWEEEEEEEEEEQEEEGREEEEQEEGGWDPNLERRSAQATCGSSICLKL
jgi:hypothetical protein